MYVCYTSKLVKKRGGIVYSIWNDEDSKVECKIYDDIHVYAMIECEYKIHV